MSVWATAERGDLNGVKAAVENGADLEERGVWKGTGLHWACGKGHVEIVKYLLDQQADVTAVDGVSRQPLHWAADRGHLEIVKLLLQHRADIHAQHEYGGTALHVASLNGHTSVDDYLIQCGAEVNSTNNHGYLPIHYACLWGHLDTVKLLISKGSDFTSTNKNGDTPLHLASQNRDSSVADYLIQRGAEVNSRDKRGYLPIHYACRNGHLHIVKLLISKGSDFTSTNENGDTPLHLASQNRDTSVADYLIQRGTEVNSRNKDGYSPIHWACRGGHLDIVKLLISEGSDFTSTDNYGDSPLHLASFNKHTSVGDYLVGRGAEVNSRNKGGYLPIHYACESGHLDTVKLLTTKGSDYTSISNNGDTPIHLAMRNGHTSVVDYLMQRGTEVAVTGIPRNDKNQAELQTQNQGSKGTVKESKIDANGRSSTKLTTIEGTATSTETFKDEKDLRNHRKWIQTSEKHRTRYQSLHEYAVKHPKKITEVNGVRVCCTREFLIGVGCDGTRVYIGLSKDGCEKAVKRLPKDTCAHLGSHEKEILNTLNALDSKHVVKYWFYDDESDDEYAFLIMDLCEETLKEYIEEQTEEDLKRNAPDIIRQILEGLRDLHRKPEPILHRDLKPSNILRNFHGKWLLADFGISRALPDDQTTHRSGQQGTRFWRAVESYPPKSKSCNEGVRYKKQSDIQVAGMVSFYILTKGQHPFGSEDDRVQNLRDGKATELAELGDPIAEDFISWMLQHIPENRPSALEALKHPYLLTSDQQFELLKCVGNEPEIKKGDTSFDVVRQLNAHPLLSKDWKSHMSHGILEYLCSDGRRPIPYGTDWTECLRLIRNTSQHWKDRPRPVPEAHKLVGEPKVFFLNKFPRLPVVVHQVIRSSDWKERSELEKYF